MKIFLVRHGQPDYETPRKLVANAFCDEVERYNSTTITVNSVIPVSTRERADEAAIVLTSDLRRSIDSAARLCPHSPAIADPIFREAGIPIRIPSPKYLSLNPVAWIIYRRFLWTLGWSGGSESLRTTISRSVEASAKLILLAQSHESVMLVGHQLFNTLIGFCLGLRGWMGPLLPGLSYWSVSTYTSRTAIKATRASLQLTGHNV